MEQQTDQPDTPETWSQDKIKTRLTVLQMKQNSKEPWTEADRQELLKLESLANRDIIDFSPDEIKALLKRQDVAGQNGNPPLTNEEIWKIRKIHKTL